MKNPKHFTRNLLPAGVLGAVILVAMLWLAGHSVNPQPWTLPGWELPYSGCSNWCS